MAKIIEWLKKKEIFELFKFVIVGGIMTVLNLLLFALFVEICKIDYITSNIISYMIAVILSYFINVIFTFKNKLTTVKEEAKKVVQYCIMKLLILGVDTCLLYVLVQLLSINVYISKIILTIVLTVASFSISKMIMKGKEK